MISQGIVLLSKNWESESNLSEGKMEKHLQIGGAFFVSSMLYSVETGHALSLQTVRI